MIGRADEMLKFGVVDIAQAAGTYYSENVVNLGGTDAGGMSVHAAVTKAAAGGTNVVIRVEAGKGNSGYKVIAKTEEIPLANLTLGAGFNIGIPRGYEGDHLKISVVTTGTFSSGEIKAWIDPYVGK